MSELPRSPTKHKTGLETKLLACEFKTAGEGSFEGLLSPYNVIDNGFDSVQPGAYDRTLAEKGNRRPLLWQHQADLGPIGELTLEDKPDGLHCKGRLCMELPEAKRAYALLKSGLLTGLSIGFKTVRDDFQNGVRLLKELALYEGSIVTFPMAEEAVITSVKSESFDEEQKILQALRDLKAAVIAIK